MENAFSRIQLPQPCHENWENMVPNEKGRFCDNCNKTVHDLTRLDTADAVNFLKAENQKNTENGVCVRLMMEQLQTPVKMVAGIAVALTSTCSSLNAQQDSGGLPNTENLRISNFSVQTSTLRYYNCRLFLDSVLRQTTGEVRISISADSFTLNTTAVHAGNFSFLIPDSIPFDTIYFSFESNFFHKRFSTKKQQISIFHSQSIDAYNFHISSDTIFMDITYYPRFQFYGGLPIITEFINPNLNNISFSTTGDWQFNLNNDKPKPKLSKNIISPKKNKPKMVKIKKKQSNIWPIIAIPAIFILLLIKWLMNKGSKPEQIQ